MSKILITILFPFLSLAQTGSFKLCDSNRVFQYYAFDAKYPVSSETLKEEANKRNKAAANINGFITFRFMVNCQGKTGNFETIQLNEAYQESNLNPAYTETLLLFVKSLNQWKTARYQDKTFDYHAFITFKIKNGLVAEIIP